MQQTTRDSDELLGDIELILANYTDDHLLTAAESYWFSRALKRIAVHNPQEAEAAIQAALNLDDPLRHSGYSPLRFSAKELRAEIARIRKHPL